MQVGSQVYLQRDFAVEKGITTLGSECPPGFRLPTKPELQELLDYTPPDADGSALGPNYLNMTVGYRYMSGSKSFPDNTDGSQNDAWRWSGVTATEDYTGMVQQDFDTYFTC